MPKLSASASSFFAVKTNSNKPHVLFAALLGEHLNTDRCKIEYSIPDQTVCIKLRNGIYNNDTISKTLIDKSFYADLENYTNHQNIQLTITEPLSLKNMPERIVQFNQVSSTKISVPVREHEKYTFYLQEFANKKIIRDFVCFLATGQRYEDFYKPFIDLRNELDQKKSSNAVEESVPDRPNSAPI